MRIDRIMFKVEQVRKGLSVTENAERSGLSRCTVTAVSEKQIQLVFDQPARAPAPGQSAVLYNGDLVAAGGFIAQLEE